jgi:hypothetical protein
MQRGGFVSSRLKFLISSFLIGVLSIGIAWAGSVITPIDTIKSLETESPDGAKRSRVQVPEAKDTPAQEGQLPPLQPGQVYAGAAKANIDPQPGAPWNNDDANTAGVWEKEGCATLGSDADQAPGHALDTRVKWAEKSGCMYSGGFGLGPMNPLTSFDEQYGLWVRSAVIGDGEDTLVLSILDGAYYFGRYRDFCDRCGFFDIAEDLGPELGINPSGFQLASTHSHASPDFIGAWGGVPQWYMDQVADAIKASIRAAYENRRPAVIEMGDEIARQFNNERRDFYHSAEENSFSWIRLYTTGDKAPDPAIAYGPGGTYEPATPPDADEEEPDKPGNGPPTIPPGHDKDPTDDSLRAVATIGAYAGHPTSRGSGPVAYSDFPGPFNHRVEELFGGVGLFFQTGLGNMSSSSGGHNEPEGGHRTEQTGYGLASLLPELGDGRQPSSTDLVTQQRFWNQPSTNSVLSGGGMVGIFDRPFEQLPASVRAGENDAKPCVSSSPVSVRTAVSAATLGNLWITGAPGEIFANYSNTIKEKNPRGITLPLALVNDGLGYIMQSFETDHAGRQGLGFAGGVVEYEDAYSIDHCFGDMAVEATLGLLGQGGTAESLP